MKYTNKVDIWALGCILYEVVCGQAAFNGDWDVMIREKRPEIWMPMLPIPLQNHLQGTLDELLQEIWQDRPTASTTLFTFVFHYRLLDPSIIGNIGELHYAPNYSAYKRLFQRNPTFREFLYALSTHFRGTGNMLPLVQNIHGDTALHWASAKGIVEVAENSLWSALPIPNQNGETALHWTAKSGNPELVSLFLSSKADVNARDKKNMTALHWAAWNGHEEVINNLLKAGCDVSVRKANGATALHLAAWQGHNSVVQSLLKAHLSPDLVQLDGRTALHRAAQSGNIDVVQTLIAIGGADVSAKTNTGETALHWAATEGHSEIVEYLLRMHANPLLVNQNGDSPLHWAVLSGQTEVARILINAYPESVLIPNSGGETVVQLSYWEGDCKTINILLSTYATLLPDTRSHPLHLHKAVWDDNLEQINELLEAGFEFSARTQDGDTVLHWAAHKGHIEIFTCLLPRFDVSVQNERGDTPLDFAARAGNNEIVQLLLNAGAGVQRSGKDGETPLHWAAWNGHVDVVKTLIAANGDVSARKDNGATPLHWAAWRGHKEVLMLLLDAGANVSAQYSSGETPLHRAVLCRDPEIVKLLLEANADISATDIKGATALHLAAEHANVAVIDELLAANADVAARTERGDTPLHCAVRKGEDWPTVFPPPRKCDTKIVKSLLAANADLLSKNGAGETALRLAVSEGDNDILQVLLDATVTSSVQRSNGGAAIHLDVAEGGKEQIPGSSSLEAVPDIFARNNDGETALHLAAMKGDNALVCALLDLELGIQIRRAMALDAIAEEERAMEWGVIRIGGKIVRPNIGRNYSPGTMGLDFSRNRTSDISSGYTSRRTSWGYL